MTSILPYFRIGRTDEWWQIRYDRLDKGLTI